MDRRLTSILLLVAVVLVTIPLLTDSSDAAGQSGSDDPTSDEVTFYGYVSNLSDQERNTPLAGVNVTLYVGDQDTDAATVTTDVLYPVLTGGIGVRYEANGAVRGMTQLQPVLVNSLGAAKVTTATGETYQTADDMQVYLWHMGVYYPTLLPTINSDDYFLIGWVDSCTAGHQVRVLTALKKD